MKPALMMLLPLVLATPAVAQTDPHAGHAMPPASPAAPAPAQATPAPAADPHAGHSMAAEPKAPAPAQLDAHAGHAMPATPEAPPPSDPHAGHAMPAQAPAPDPHAGHDVASPGAEAASAMTGSDQPVGSDTPPPPPSDRAADRYYDRGAMDRAQGILRDEHGGVRTWKVMADQLEYRSSDGENGWQWDGEAWFGGDIHRFVFKSEGEAGDDGVEAGEVQALYSRAVGRYTDVQAGVRHDFEPGSQTYATIGVETLFPYWFEAEAALFLSQDGDLIARTEGSYDLRLTQRLVLQPRAELEFSAQDVPETQTGSGLSSAELGLRLRYEVRREFAPYIGVTYERAFGGTADYARAAGHDEESTSFVVGLRAWF